MNIRSNNHVYAIRKLLTVAWQWRDPIPKTALVELAELDYARAIGMIDALVFCGLLEFHHDADNRVVLVTITSAGLTALAAAGGTV